MGSEWSKLPLGTLATIHDSLRKPVKKSDRKPGPYPYYGASGIADHVEDFVFDGTYVLLAEDGDNLRTKNTPIAFLAKGKFWVNNHAHVLQGVDELDTQYLCYALQYAEVDSFISGSTRPKITQADLKKIPVAAPPLDVRRKIAALLRTLDDKIELNCQINTTLEAMAQALFKSWFVDFDPVIDNALAAGNPIPVELAARAERRAKAAQQQSPEHPHTLPAAIRQQFPDRFVFTDTMGWVPEGWRVENLGAILELAYGKSLPANKRVEGDIPVYGSGGASGFHNEKLVDGPGIVVGRKGTVGSLYWIEGAFYPIDTVFYVVVNAEIPLFWIYQALQLLDIKSMGADSAVPGVNRNVIYARQVAVPNKAALDRYCDEINSINARRHELLNQNITVTHLRDTLLPKLLSGQLRIPEAEQLVAEVI